MTKLTGKIVEKQQKFVKTKGSFDEEKTKLIAQKTNDDHDLLSMVGLSNAELDSDLKSFDEYLRVSNKSKEYGFCISEETIKELADKYDLKLLESCYYKYSVPVSITKDIKKWKESLGDKFDNRSDSFFILAPSEHFYSSKVEFDKYNNKTKGSCKKDPILLYKTVGGHEQKGNVYSLISEWGSDLKPTRRIRGFIFENLKTISIVGVITTILMSTYMFGSFIDKLTEGLDGNTWITYTGAFLVAIMSSIFSINLFNIFDPFNKTEDSLLYTKKGKNYSIFEIKDYSGFTFTFGAFYLRNTVSGLIGSLIMFMFFIMGRPSFSEVLGIQNIIFLLPTMFFVCLIVIGLIGGFFRKV